MGHAQSEFASSIVRSASNDETRPGTLLLNSAEIPSSKPVSMNGSASQRSLQLSQSMPDPSNSTAPSSSSSSTAPNGEQIPPSSHFPQRQRNNRSKACKLNMKRSGSHPNSLSQYVQAVAGNVAKNASVSRMNLHAQQKSPEKHLAFEAFPPKDTAVPRKLSSAIFEEESNNQVEGCVSEARKGEEVSATLPSLEADKPTANITAHTEIVEVQMKENDENHPIETCESIVTPETASRTPSLSSNVMCSSTDCFRSLSEYEYHYSAEGLLYFFDWDDTLLCSSYLRHLNYSLHSELDDLDTEFRLSLQQLDCAIANLLASVFNNVTKNVFIITNSESGWVERSAMKFLPKTYGFFSEVNFFGNILSARDIYCRTVPEAASKYAQCLKTLQTNPCYYQSNNLAHINAAMSQPLQWKEFVFEKTIKEWIRENKKVQDAQLKLCTNEQMKNERKEQPIHVICMGDTVERTAIINALSTIAPLARAPATLFPNVHNGNVTGGNVAENSESQPMYGPSVDEAFEISKLLSEKKMILKSIKFPERPHVTQLEKQVNLIASVLNYLSTHNQPLDLYLSLAVVNNQSNNNNSSKTCTAPEKHEECSAPSSAAMQTAEVAI